MNNKKQPHEVSIGVVGLGLMGSSIVVSLLIAGHKVIAIAPIAEDMKNAHQRIIGHLAHCDDSGILSQSPSDYLAQLIISEDYRALTGCSVVLECVIEIQEIKAEVYRKIESFVEDDAVIASNTSAIPISELQKLVNKPDRFLGIHWAEPSYLTRFLEITCGLQTKDYYADWIFQLAHCWGKEPTLLRKDIRGFVTNRLMYAVYREAFDLVEKKAATLEDIDKSFRYDAGSWMTLMGVFRRMDFLGLKDYQEIFKNVFPGLSNSEKVPGMMEKLVALKARGTQTLQGLYKYTPEEARKLEKAYALFNEDIYKLAARYPAKSENESADVEIKTSVE
jgi:3-hydroxybutyryl-CoA dehydrogenase